MESREEIKKEALEYLTKIKTLDDLKEHKDDIIQTMIKMIKSALEILKSFFETAFSMSSEEKAEELSKFQDDNFLFTKEVEDELDRIYNIPGADEFMDTFQQDLEEQMEPYMEEITQQMTKLAEEFMGDLMGGLGEGLGAMMGESDADEELSSEPREDEKLDVGQIIYQIQSIEDLMKNEDRIITQIEDQLNADLYTMEYNKKIGMVSNSMVQAGLMRIEKRQKLLERELDREFNRIGTLPGAKEQANASKEKIKKKLEPTVKQINELLKELISEN
jgi:hypothetical protein